MANPRGDFQLALGYWIVSHRQQFRTWWAITLLSFLALSLVWVVIFFATWFTHQPKLDNAIAGSAAAIQRFTPPATLTPTPLTAGDVTVIHRDAQHIDLVARVRNTNTAWGAASFEYRFIVDGKALPTQTAFLNSDADRPVIQLNQASAAQSAQIEIGATTWKRSSAAEFPAPSFTTGKIEVVPTNVTLNGQSFLSVRVTATITNRSVYNFLKVKVPILVYLNNDIVAVDEQTLDRWDTLTSKTVTTTWPFAIGQSTSGEVAPQVSQFDRNNLY